MSCILAKRKKVAFVLHAIKGNQIYLCQSLEFKKICTKTVTFQKSPNKLSMFCFFFLVYIQFFFTPKISCFVFLSKKSNDCSVSLFRMQIVNKLCFVRVIGKKCFSSTSTICFPRNFDKKWNMKNLDSFGEFSFTKQLRTVRKFSFLISQRVYSNILSR